MNLCPKCRLTKHEFIDDQCTFHIKDSPYQIKDIFINDVNVFDVQVIAACAFTVVSYTAFQLF